MKKVSKILLATLCAIPMALAIPACGNNGGGGDSPAQQISTKQAFEKLDVAFENVLEYEDDLTLTEEFICFSGTSKNEMNSPGACVSTSSTIKSYDGQTGHFFMISPYWNGTYTSAMTKSFGDEIAYFELQDDGVAYDYYLVDKAYGAYKVKENRFSLDKYGLSILNTPFASFLSYDHCIQTFNEVKANDLSSPCAVDAFFFVNSASQGANKKIEAVYTYQSESEYTKEESVYTYKICFNDDFLVSFQRIDENTSINKENNETFYNYNEEKLSFSKTFLQDQYNDIDTSSLHKPTQKVSQDVKLYIDEVSRGVFSEPFGTSLEYYINLQSPRENSSGYKAYLDKNHTIPYTGQTTFSYKPTEIYLISQPAQGYATIFSRFIYEEKSGERKIDLVSSEIVEAIDDRFSDTPIEGTFQPIQQTFTDARFDYPDLYINGEKQEQYTSTFLAMPGEIYYIDRIHKQQDFVSLNLYDSLTGQFWTTLNQFEKGTYWGYVLKQIQINPNIRYHGLELGGLRISGINGAAEGSSISSDFRIEDGMNIYMMVRPGSSSINMFIYQDLSTETTSATIYQYDSSGSIKLYLSNYESLTVNDVELKVDGVASSVSSSDGKFTYDPQTGKVTIHLKGGTTIIKYS